MKSHHHRILVIGEGRILSDGSLVALDRCSGSPWPLPAGAGHPPAGGTGGIAMPDSLRLYLRYIDISFRAQMQYRASFIMLSVGHFLLHGGEFAGVLVLFDRFQHLLDWRLEEVALFYGMVNMAFSFTDATSRGFDSFSSMVKSGDFDRLLLRPRSTALQLAGQEDFPFQ